MKIKATFSLSEKSKVSFFRDACFKSVLFDGVQKFLHDAAHFLNWF